MELTPTFLLHNPELVTPVAPWCVAVENLELGILLLAQPWMAGDGVRRADLERQLGELAVTLPLGPVYFQRVKRAVARLVEIGAMQAVGSGRSQSFVVTAQGFATLILNLRVLRADPTIDGSEFELKRALVAMWNLVLERMGELPEEVQLPPESERFFDQVEELTVLGEQVISEQVMAEALDLLRLVATQREQVKRLLAAALQRLDRAEAEAGTLRGVDLSQLAARGFDRAAAILADTPGALAMVRGMAAGVLPQLNLRATVLRYRQYLQYLDELTTLYAGELKTVDLDAVRGILIRPKVSGSVG
jgi:hypothetical protein